MFALKVDDKTELRLVHTKFAQEHYDIITANKDHIGYWLDWAYKYQSIQDSYNFINYSLQNYAKGEAIECFIFYENKLIGGVGFPRIKPANNSGEIGYWLAKEYTGKGIMTNCVKKTIELGFNFLKLNKIIIRVAIGNQSSEKIARRLGFTQEGILREDIANKGSYLDGYTFGLLKSEWKAA